MKKLSKCAVLKAIKELSDLPLIENSLSALLLKLNLTWEEFVELSSSDDVDVRKAIRVITMYKEHWEFECEKLLLRQNNKFYDYKMLKWLLEQSNKSKYLGVKKTNTMINGYSLDKDLVNESGIDIFNKKGVMN